MESDGEEGGGAVTPPVGGAVTQDAEPEVGMKILESEKEEGPIPSTGEEKWGYPLKAVRTFVLIPWV